MSIHFATIDPPAGPSGPDEVHPSRVPKESPPSPGPDEIDLPAKSPETPRIPPSRPTPTEPPRVPNPPPGPPKSGVLAA